MHASDRLSGLSSFHVVLVIQRGYKFIERHRNLRRISAASPGD